MGVKQEKFCRDGPGGYKPSGALNAQRPEKLRWHGLPGRRFPAPVGVPIPVFHFRSPHRHPLRPPSRGVTLWNPCPPSIHPGIPRSSCQTLCFYCKKQVCKMDFPARLAASSTITPLDQQGNPFNDWSGAFPKWFGGRTTLWVSFVIRCPNIVAMGRPPCWVRGTPLEPAPTGAMRVTCVTHCYQERTGI